MRASEIAKVFETIAPPSLGIQSDRDSNYLGFRFGDPATEVKKVGVAWWMDADVLEQAVKKKVNMLMVHEPDLFRSWKSPFHKHEPSETMPYHLKKMKLLLNNNIVVYGAHTNWDLQEEYGMLISLEKKLGWTPFKAGRDGALGLYNIKGMKLGKLIELLKKKLNIPYLRYQGEAGQKAEKIVLGFGSLGSEAEAIFANKADVGVFGELREWPFIFAKDEKKGIIELTHTVSESIGFESVAVEMRKRVPGIKFEFLKMKYPYNVT